MVKSSAPGKMMIIGDHAVVHGKPCIVTAIDKRMSVEITKRDDNKIVVTAPEMSLDKYEIDVEKLNVTPKKETQFIESAITHFFKKYKVKSGLNIATKSEFTDKKSFGSSAAVTVSTLKCLDALFNTKMTEKELFEMAYQSHTMDVQKGNGSGFDVAAATYGGIFVFVREKGVVEKINVDQLPIIYACFPIKFDTSVEVKRVSDEAKENVDVYDKLFDTAGTLVEKAKQAIKNKDWKKLGLMMNMYEGLLVSMRVSTEYAEKVWYKVKEAGALGAKMCGAGGDNIMILATENQEKIKQILKENNGEVIDIKPNASCVRIEK